MPGVNDPSRGDRAFALNSFPGAIHLAIIAAPFAAAGSSDDSAILRAKQLLLTCQGAMWNNVHVPTMWSLEDLKAELGVTGKTLKKYMREVLNASEFEQIWKKALQQKGCFKCIHENIAGEIKLRSSSPRKSRMKSP